MAGGKGHDNAPKRKRGTRASSSQRFDANMFRSLGCKNFYDTFPVNPPFVREKAIRLTPGDYPEIQANIQERGWEKFVSYPKKASKALTFEFIANVNPQPAIDGTLTFPPNTSFVRGRIIPFDQITINELFEIPHVPVAECGFRDRLRRKPKEDEDHAVEILRTLCKPHVDWERNGYGDPKKIKTKNLTPIARGWADFILHTISPCSNQTELHIPRASLATAIIQREPINLGLVLKNELLELSKIKLEKKPWWRHASLITLLCEKAGVVVEAEEKVIEPGKPITGDWIRIRSNLVQAPPAEPQAEPQAEQEVHEEPMFQFEDFEPQWQPSREDFQNLQGRIDALELDQRRMAEEQRTMGEEQRMGMRAIYRAICTFQRGEQVDPHADIFQAPPQ